MFNYLNLSCLTLLFLIVSCSQPNAEPSIAETDDIPTSPVFSSEATEAVLNRHLEAFGNNDLEAVLADYADDAILITPDATLKGKEEIGALFTEVFPLFPKGEFTLTMDKLFIDNELAYIVWHAETPSVVVSIGTDTFIIKDNKIQQQTFTATITPVESEETPS